MNLPTGFQFSQASLQDFVDCRRRFQLRYLWQLDWPAIENEPVLEREQHMQRGTRFHRMVQQHLLGIPEERLSRTIDSPQLRRWWENYLAHPLEGLPANRYPEISLSAPLGEYRLIAKYDLLALDPGERAWIVDWKTSLKRPGRAWLEARLQTRVYRYLLVVAGAHLNGGSPIEPQQVEMVYWFAEFPQGAHRFAYDAAQFRDDQAYLQGLVARILELGEDEFPLTSREERCLFCPYRSLCDRGVRAGQMEEMLELDAEQPPSLDWELEQIAEIEF